MRVDLNATAFFSNSSNQMESLLTATSFYVEWIKNNNLLLTLNRFYDKVPTAFGLSKSVEILPGEYVNKDITVTYQSPPVDFLNAILTATTGTFYGGNRFSAGITPSYVISKYFTLSGFYQYNHISFTNTSDYVAHVARLKVATALNVKLSINAFLQANSLTQVSALNFRLRYNPKDGNDLYLVYNETINNHGKRDPYLPF